MVNKTTREGAAILDLLAACWEIEDGAGGWNGADVVDLVCQTFDSLGLDINHPATREGGTGDVEDYDEDVLRAFARGEGVHPESECDCSDLVPGVLLGWNGCDEIQRCDDCGRFQTDEQAAHVAAAKVGGKAVEKFKPCFPSPHPYWVVEVGDRLRLAGDGPSFTIVED